MNASKNILIGNLILNYRFLNNISQFIYNQIESAIKEANLSEVEPLLTCQKDSIVSIGDVHGGLEELLVILKKANFIDNNGDWIGKNNNKLVMQGDYIDRGKYTASIYFFLRNLQEQAKKADQKVVLLIGNHELLLLEDSYRSYEKTQSLETYKVSASFLRSIIEKDIKNNDLTTMFFSEEKNVIFIHADCEKLLKELFIKYQLNKQDDSNLTKKDMDFKNRIISEVDLRTRVRFEYFNKAGQLYSKPLLVEGTEPLIVNNIIAVPKLENKISNLEISRFMKVKNLTNKDLEKWLNDSIKKYISDPSNEELYIITRLATWSRRSFFKLIEGQSKTKTNKQTYISVGHCNTYSRKIETNKNRIFTDTAISKSYAEYYNDRRLSFTLYDENHKIYSYNSCKINKDLNSFSPSKIPWENPKILFEALPLKEKLSKFKQNIFHKEMTK